MKKVVLSLFSLALLLCLMIYSCQKETSPSKESSPNESLETKNVNSQITDHKSGWIPEGSRIDSSAGGYIVTPPPGWAYIGYGPGLKSFNAMEHVNTSISCTCNTSGSCKPFLASGPGGSISGCGGTCTNCTMTQSLYLERNRMDILSGGYYSPILAPRLLNSGERAPAVFQALFESEAFQKELESFLRIAHNGKPMKHAVHNNDGSVTAPFGYSLAAVSIMGRTLVVVLPEEFITKQPGEYSLASSASCSCSQGSCSLKDKTILGTGAIWCDGNCTTCTLTINPRSLQPSAPMSIQSFAY